MMKLPHNFSAHKLIKIILIESVNAYLQIHNHFFLLLLIVGNLLNIFACLRKFYKTSQAFHMEKPCSAQVVLLLQLLFLSASMHCCFCRTNLSVGCIQQERDTLLKFKGSLFDPSRQLKSWTANTDCCKYWTGVLCNATTGHVVKLDLRHENVVKLDLRHENKFSYENYTTVLQGRNVNRSLLGLRYLNYLDLSGNDFQGSPIPEFFGSMKDLRYLNLSGAGFSGIVPRHLGNISSLLVLDLSNHGGDLVVDDFMWVSQLALLKHLDLSGVDLSYLARAKNLVQVLNMLPALVKVRLSFCQLTNYHLSHTYANSSLANLQVLDLSRNYFEGEIPQLLLNMTALRTLDLSQNNFNSSLAFLFGLRNLISLNLANNKFNHIQGGFPTFLWNKCHLETLDLSENAYQGELLSFTGNLSGCLRYSLVALKLSGNLFTGPLPDKLEQLRLLKYLDLSRNFYLTGPIPPSLGNLTSLKLLSLSGNLLNGTIPISLGNLSNLEKLDLASNNLDGVVSEAHFSKMAMLREFRISSNFLTMRVQSGWKPPFQLQQIFMESCNLQSEFPRWLQTQKEVIQLYLPNSSISGTLPEWLHYMKLTELDLSNNMLSGALPRNISDMMPGLTSLLLGGNRLNGAIPNSFCKIKSLQVLDLSRNSLSGNIPACWNNSQELKILKLSSNRLSGIIPNSIGPINSLQALDLSENNLTGDVPDVWNKFPELIVLKLSSNRLSGIIPKSIGHSSALQWLHLNNNSFTGEIPSTLRNCSMLVVLDVGDNGLTGEIPKWIGEDLQSLIALRLHQNLFSGIIPQELCLLFQLQVMDLGYNHLSGNIPHCFGNFSGMVLVEDSTNSEFATVTDAQWDDESMLLVLKGLKQEYTKTLVFAVHLDLSNNELSGKIPEELTNLTGLIGLNLSHNYLTGRIPGNIGSMKSLESLDLSNNYLSAEIPHGMSDLKFLSHLNLSYNNFSGQIPTGSQLRTLNDPSIYAGNRELCGAPLLKKCNPDQPSHESPAATEYHEAADDENRTEESIVFYGFCISGFATGFWGVLAILVLKRSWRRAFFSFLDAAIERILLEIALRFKKFPTSG